jgi:hypothetical protein
MHNAIRAISISQDVSRKGDGDMGLDMAPAVTEEQPPQPP